jgi:hypothetical protein
MTTLRRFLITAIAVGAVSAVASASTITIGYSTTISTTSTDITNLTALLPAFNPGDSNSTTSNISGNGYTTGISMASLNTAGTSYILTGFNISIDETLTGSYTITNTSTTSDAVGNAHIDTYTAVALGSTLSPALSGSTDSTNDLYNCSATVVGAHSGSCSGANQGEQIASVGGGPDPNAPSSGSFDLAQNGGTYSSGPINVTSKWVDYGCEIATNAFCNETNVNNAANNELTSNLGLVEGPPDLTFYVSTATQTDTSVTGGNLTTAYNTSVGEQVEVTYTFTETSTPEPTTMALMGGALLGLGLMRKRLKKS